MSLLDDARKVPPVKLKAALSDQQLKEHLSLALAVMRDEIKPIQAARILKFGNITNTSHWVFRTLRDAMRRGMIEIRERSSE